MMYTYITLCTVREKLGEMVHWHFTYLEILWDMRCMREEADKQMLRDLILRNYWNTTESFFERVSFNFIIVYAIDFVGGFLVHCD